LEGKEAAIWAVAAGRWRRAARGRRRARAAAERRDRGEKRGGRGSLPHRGAATVVRAEDWRRRCRIAVAQELGRRRRKSERRHGGARAGGESWGRQRRLRGNVRKGSQLRRGGPRRAVIRLTEPPLLTGLSRPDPIRARPASRRIQTGGLGPRAAWLSTAQEGRARDAVARATSSGQTTGPVVGKKKTGEKHGEGEESDPWG
jgi:hypothetical protein